MKADRIILDETPLKPDYVPEELVDRNVVFELKEPNQFVTNFFVEAVSTRPRGSSTL